MRQFNVNGFDEWIKTHLVGRNFSVAEIELMQEAFHGGILYGEELYHDHVNGEAFRCAHEWLKAKLSALESESLATYSKSPLLEK